MTNFAEKIELLDNLGIQYHRAYEYRGEPGKGRERYDLDLFDSVLFPFTSEEWCRLCMREGDLYIGGCCGNTSNLQDYLNGWFRDGGWVKVKDLARFCDSIFNHEGFEDWDDKVSISELHSKIAVQYELEAPHSRWIEDADPLNKLALVWKLVKDHYDPERPSIIHEKYRNDPYTSMSNLARSLQSMSWHQMLVGRDREESTQDKSWKYAALAKIIPSLKELSDNIHKLNQGPFVSFAIVSKDATEEIATNGLGQCVYVDENKVKEIFTLWDKADDEYEERDKTHYTPARDRFKVRKVIVSVENGIEFGEFVEV